MKNFLLVLLGFFSVLAFSQEEEKKDRTLREDFRNRKPGIFRLYTGLTAPDEDTPYKFDRFNSAFFWNSWIGKTNNTKTRFYALGHDLNLMFDIPFGKRSPIGIGIGLGYSHFCVRTDGEFTFMTDTTGGGQYSSLATYTGPKRWINRTVFDFVEVPFEIRIRTLKERKKFKFYPGFKLGYMFESYHKWRIQSNEYKEFNFPDLNRWHYGPTIRIGYNNIMLWGYYDLTTLFKNPNSNELQLFGAGISIGWF